MNQFPLNPCPYCGRPANLGRTLGGWRRVMCWGGSGARRFQHTVSIDASSTETARALWNSKPRSILLRSFIFSNQLMNWWNKLNGYNNFTFGCNRPKIVKKKAISIRWFSYDHSRTSWKVFFTKYTERYHRQNEKVYQINVWTRKHMMGFNLAISY